MAFQTVRAVGSVRTERPRACSDFDVVHGLRAKTMSIGDGAGQSAWRA